MTVKFAPAALSVSTTCVVVPIVVEVKVNLQVATIAIPMVIVVHVVQIFMHPHHSAMHVRMEKLVVLVALQQDLVYKVLLYVLLNKIFVIGLKIQTINLIGQEKVEQHRLEVQVHQVHKRDRITYTLKQMTQLLQATQTIQFCHLLFLLVILVQLILLDVCYLKITRQIMVTTNDVQLL